MTKIAIKHTLAQTNIAKTYTLGKTRSPKKGTLGGGTSPGAVTMEEPPAPVIEKPYLEVCFSSKNSQSCKIGPVPLSSDFGFWISDSNLLFLIRIERLEIASELDTFGGSVFHPNSKSEQKSLIQKGPIRIMSPTTQKGQLLVFTRNMRHE